MSDTLAAIENGTLARGEVVVVEIVVLLALEVPVQHAAPGVRARVALEKLLERAQWTSDDKYFRQAYRIYMNLIWLNGEVGPGAGDVAGFALAALPSPPETTTLLDGAPGSPPSRP